MPDVQVSRHGILKKRNIKLPNHQIIKFMLPSLPGPTFAALRIVNLF
jgi:hypothetical protein